MLESRGTVWSPWGLAETQVFLLLLTLIVYMGFLEKLQPFLTELNTHT